MFIYILFGIAIGALPNANISMGPLIQSFGDIEDLDQIVYLNYTVSDNFNYDSFPSLSCCPNNVTKFRVMELNPNGSQIQQFDIPFFIENLSPDPLFVASLTITELFSYQDIPTQVNYSTETPINFGPKQYMTLKFSHLCNKTLNKDRYWSIKTVSLELKGFDPVSFNYQFLCGNNYYPVRYLVNYHRFDWSNIILIIAESIIILVLSIFGKIYAFKVVFITKQLQLKLDKEKLERIAQESKPFQGFSLSWHQALLYMGLLLGALFISLYLQEKAERPIQIIIYVLCCLCTFHFVNELFSSFRKQIPFFVKPIFFFRYCDVFALAIGAALIALYLVIDQIWILSNLITICILGSLIKLLKIKSLKNSLLFFLPIMAIDIFCSIYLALTIRYEWDSLILRYFNTPLSAQIPYFRFIYKKKCAWVSIFNILFPGFFLAYVHRFDKHKQTLVYEIVSFFGLLIGLVLWVIVQYLTSFPLPTSIFTEVLMILFCTLIAFRRNELNLFWSGDYYDEILYDPFKNELDKKSIKVINFFNMGVSKEIIKKYAVNSQVERVATQYQPFELVRANQTGELQLDSILFEGLYSFHQENLFEQSDHRPNSPDNQHEIGTNQISNQRTIETNQRKEINSAEKDDQETPQHQDKNGENSENEPLIQKVQSIKRSGTKRQEQPVPKLDSTIKQNQEVADPLNPQQNQPETKLTYSQTLQQNKLQEEPQINGSVIKKQESLHPEPPKLDDSKQQIQSAQSADKEPQKQQDQNDQGTQLQQQLLKTQQEQNLIIQTKSEIPEKLNQNPQKGQDDPKKVEIKILSHLPESKNETNDQKQEPQPEKSQEKKQENKQLLKPNEQQIGRKVESIIDQKQVPNNQQKIQQSPAQQSATQQPPPKQPPQQPPLKQPPQQPPLKQPPLQPPPQQPPQEYITHQQQYQRVTPVSQKYPINQSAKPPEDRFKQKQQLREQPKSDVFKKNLEFFQKQEQAQNYKAPVKK